MGTTMKFIGKCTECDYDTGICKSHDDLISTIAADGGSVGTRPGDLFCPDCQSLITMEVDQ